VWVRRVIFLARLSLLVADIALDIRIVAWLMADGSIKEADVCAAFIALAQLVVALGVFANIVSCEEEGIAVLTSACSCSHDYHVISIAAGKGAASAYQRQ
jgi:hypothetical protein